MGVSERLQRVKANFHEHPLRDWLLVAIGLGTLVVAIIALRNSSGSGTLSPVNPVPPTGPGGGGGGGGGPTGPVNGAPVLGTGPGQPTGGTGGGSGEGITPGQWINTASGATDSQSDPSYGSGQGWNNGLTGIAQQDYEASGGSTAALGGTPNNPTSASQLAHRGKSGASTTTGGATKEAPAPTRGLQADAMTSTALHSAPTLNQRQQAPAHTVAQPIEQKPVLRSGVIRRGGVH